MTDKLDVFGDWLMFDGRPLASLAGLDPGRRMMLVETLAGLIDPDTKPELDLRGCVPTVLVLNEHEKVVGEHFPGPPLPDGYQLLTVLQMTEVESAAEGDGFEVLLPEIPEPPKPKRRKRK